MNYSPNLMQLSLLEFDLSSFDEQIAKRVLGGSETLTAHGWIEFRAVKRKRKNGDVWECKQAWLHWEEPGGKKRSRYIPKGKFADVETLVYGQRVPLVHTLKLLEK